MKKSWFLYTAIALAVIVLSSWDYIYPVRIIDIHRSTNRLGYDYIIVDHFPLTDRGRINWWLSQRDMLKKKYNIPSGQRFVLTVWDVGDGYLRDSPHEDYFCFSEMTSEKNCIEKIELLEVTFRFPESNKIKFYVDGNLYIMNKKDGSMTKERY
ncbi:TPA: DUF943 family protein [Enterobacter hormaechei]|uniref:DUF943 family protein n=1 Tax=Enterobacter sp. DTU_2021_1002640_1_SI_PRY_ASU_LCPMC_013 TaxID=3077940 RepID=UPI001A13223C|nr:DUF943 family protein [Enterobacter sp. DTU_2021_1002640_1_SI_PRY_ASU_LCPMC_013]EGQ5290688.1 DUF943 family protein [Enterobacter hormaechei]WNV01451.1 DUF943 family protein [Enterobacter sp. DTU_2021_1002640_1_SI_PRY_ASU_LCPMC_013]